MLTIFLIIQVADGDEPLPSDDSISRTVSINGYYSLVLINSSIGVLTPMQDIIIGYIYSTVIRCIVAIYL